MKNPKNSLSVVIHAGKNTKPHAHIINPNMPYKVTIIALTIATIVSTGCSTMQVPKVNDSAATGGAVSGAAVGAIAGNVIGYATGGNRTVATLVGAAIGGLIGYQQGKAQDVAEAKKLADELAARNKIAAKVESYDYQAKDDKTGQTQKVSALKSIEAPLPADAIKAKDKQLTETLNKFGQFAANRSEPMIVTVAGKKADLVYLKSSIAAGIPAEKAASVKIETITAPSAKVTVRPAEIKQSA